MIRIVHGAALGVALALALSADDIEVTVARAHGEKCERCWNYSTRVGESSDFPTVCERCVAALQEIELN